MKVLFVNSTVIALECSGTYSWRQGSCVKVDHAGDSEAAYSLCGNRGEERKARMT